MTAAYKNSDKCTDMILDFIAGGVPGNRSGETQGNYNAIFGHVHNADDLSARTIEGIYKLQAEMLKHDRRSTAVGRYQFLRGTLQGLQKELGLSASEQFTPELQDRLALVLLVRRGYRKWWTGAITDDQFAHNISLEWASLPDPENGGKSHYDGDTAGNHASTTLDKVRDMLEDARAAKPQQTAAAARPAGAALAAAPGEVGHLPEHMAELNHLPDHMAAQSPQDWVKDIQTTLQKAGFYKGPIDGIWGQGSDDALDDLLDGVRD